jgi:hypothetical protein
MTFKPHPEAEERRRSATALVKLLLANRGGDVLTTHLRELLRILLWKMTQAEAPTHRTRFQSESALRAATGEPLRHDHVFQSANMIDELLEAKSNEAIERILDCAVGCTVTLDEHSRLHRFDDEYGWERYSKAGIVVMDTSKHPPTPRV